MTSPADTVRSKHHRFPGDILPHGVWLSYRFTLSSWDAQELLFEHGITVSHEALRQRWHKLLKDYTNRLRRRRPQPGNTWYALNVSDFVDGRSWSVGGGVRRKKAPLCARHRLETREPLRRSTASLDARHPARHGATGAPSSSCCLQTLAALIHCQCHRKRSRSTPVPPAPALAPPEVAFPAWDHRTRQR